MGLIRLEDKLNIFVEPVKVQVYDFDFELHLTCSHPYAVEVGELCVLRIGVIDDYPRQELEMRALGLRLVNSPEEHKRCSELPNWYPLIADLTPRSIWADVAPTIEEIEALFDWPVFIKGERQTSRHNPELSIIRDADHYRKAMEVYRQDRILHWQRIVVREFVRLVPVPGEMPGKIRSSMEFRSFWWFGRCVGVGRYWYASPPYGTDDMEKGLEIAGLAAARLDVPFIVIDFAKTMDGRWIVIECNDAQESSYAAILPQALWRSVLDGIAA